MTNTKEQDTKHLCIGVEEVVDHEDGSATYQFSTTDEATKDLAEVGIEFLLYCAAYGWDMQDALDSLKREGDTGD